MNTMDSFDLTGKTAIVTGGGRGIGRAIAIGLSDAGAKTIPTARSTHEIRETAEIIENNGGEATSLTADVTNETSIHNLIEETIETYGGLDILVNNAGVNPDDALGKPETVTVEGFDTTIAVNLRGAFLLTHEAAELLHDSQNGSVINIASVGGLVGLPRQHPYVASKHGLIGITKSMAIDWAPSVRVNAISPGYVETELIEEALKADHIRDALLRQTPLDRFADPEEIAGPAVFLASDASSYVTGAVIAADGGWTAR